VPSARADTGPLERPTRPVRPLAPLDEPPNYKLRRVVVLLVPLLVVAGVVGFVVTRSGGEATEATDETHSTSSPVPTTARPPLTAPNAAAAEFAADAEEIDLDDLPIHVGFRPDVLYVALYGKVDTDSLGVLGEQTAATAVAAAREVGEEYEPFAETVVPTFEIIASVASFEAGPDRDYSNESPIEQLQPWIDAADEGGAHVVLDLQSGRQRFSSQIREFEELMLEPHVSVALDPEWRVGDNEVPKGGRVGTVSAKEVNDTVDYLDDLIVQNNLPPKMLIVHQFEDGMISSKTDIRGTDNVQIVIHMDGFGPLRLKRETYDRVAQTLPDGALMGWKNFYDEDKPTPTAAETMADDPTPMFVSFQ